MPISHYCQPRWCQGQCDLQGLLEINVMVSMEEAYMTSVTCSIVSKLPHCTVFSLVSYQPNCFEFPLKFNVDCLYTSMMAPTLGNNIAPAIWRQIRIAGKLLFFLFVCCLHRRCHSGQRWHHLEHMFYLRHPTHISGPVWQKSTLKNWRNNKHLTSGLWVTLFDP